MQVLLSVCNTAANLHRAISVIVRSVIVLCASAVRYGTSFQYKLLYAKVGK
jgi:hypothetical protein